MRSLARSLQFHSGDGEHQSCDATFARGPVGTTLHDTKGDRLMRLSRWQPWNAPLWTQMQHLQHEMNRLFDRWAGEGTRFLGIAPMYPAVNVWEEGDHVFVEAELPGLDL